MTRFERRNQFVELALNGAELHHRWGATGRNEHQRVQTFADEAAAKFAWDKQLRRLSTTAIRRAGETFNSKRSFARHPTTKNR